MASRGWPWHEHRMLMGSGLPLNPFDVAPPLRYDIPIIAGRFPKVGHLPALAWDSPGFFAWAAERYGGCAWVDRGFGSYVLQLAGEASHQILRNKGTASSALYDVAPLFLGHSMIVVDGREHRRVRGASAHAFTPAGLNRARVGSIIAEVVEQRVAGWTRRSVLPIAREARELALAVIFRLIGIPAADLPAWRHHFEELALTALNLPWDFPGSPMRRGLRAKAWLDERVRRIVRRCREERDGTSMVGAMVHGRDDSGQAQDDAELVDNIKLLVLAGHETVANALSWAVALILTHPAVLTGLLAELDGASAKGPLTAEAIDGLPLLAATVRETLRLWPGVPMVGRILNKPARVGDYDLPAGLAVVCSVYLAHRRAEVYPEPAKFQPERYQANSRDETAERQHLRRRNLPLERSHPGD